MVEGISYDLVNIGVMILPVVAYVRNALLIAPSTKNFEAEKAVILSVLGRLNIPVGYDSLREDGKSNWGTFSTETTGGVQCGYDNYPLPNGMTSGGLKDALENELKENGFNEEKLA